MSATPKPVPPTADEQQAAAWLEAVVEPKDTTVYQPPPIKPVASMNKGYHTTGFVLRRKKVGSHAQAPKDKRRKKK